MIVVTGANGKLGRAVVERLLELVPAAQVGVAVRDPQKADDLAARGVRVRHGDFGAPASLADAFAGATRLLIISTDVVGDARAELHRNAVDAAQQARVGQIIYTSVTNPDPASPFAAAADHFKTEAHIRASGLPFTFLRNGFYTDVLPLLVGAAFGGGAVEAAADGPAAYVARSDLAEATGNLLAHGGYAGETLELTGSEALDLAQVTAIVGEITGRPAERRVLTDAAYRAALIAGGFPPPGADTFLGIFAALRERRFSHVYPDLEKLLGRPPLTIAAFLQATVAAGPPA